MNRRPDPMPRFHRWRSNILQVPVMAVVTVTCGSVALFFSLFEKKGRVQHRIAQFWARMLVLLSGSKLTVRGAENLRRFPVAVFASNHTSYMDTPVVFASLPIQFRILAKKELWPIPFIGWYLNRSGQIPIDTKTARGTLTSLAAGVRALNSGTPLFVFPEGGRTQDGDLQSFMSGAAYLAIKAQVPLIPIALSGVYDLLPIHTRHFYPTEMTLAVGEPIETTGMTVRQVNELNERLRTTINEMIEQSESCGQTPMLT
jgi:1-acyl-sn-glycerol-3-phosphate acyltransferase